MVLVVPILAATGRADMHTAANKFNYKSSTAALAQSGGGPWGYGATDGSCLPSSLAQQTCRSAHTPAVYCSIPIPDAQHSTHCFFFYLTEGVGRGHLQMPLVETQNSVVLSTSDGSVNTELFSPVLFRPNFGRPQPMDERWPGTGAA